MYLRLLRLHEVQPGKKVRIKTDALVIARSGKGLLQLDAGGRAVDATKNADGTYSFKQPAGKVTITAAFRKAETRFDVVDPAKGGSLNRFKAGDTYKDSMFKDVVPGAWYVENVRAAVNYGLMQGMGDEIFGVGKNLKVCEALALTCRLHNIYYGGSGVFDETQGQNWYDVYVDYAKLYGFFPQGLDLGAPITRGQFAVIVSAALPDEALKPINSVTELPDVEKDDPGFAAILRLYNAGILNGMDGQGNFCPDLLITREQIAAVATRIADPSMRKTVTL